MTRRRNRRSTPVSVRFWKYVERAGDDECWIWHGSTISKGYGQLETRRDGRRYVALAHRISFEMHVGAIPDGLFVCHTCDNPPCVNPKHLFLGSNKDNIHDAMTKGRVPHLTDADRKVRGERHPASKDPGWGRRGETNGFAKLTSDQVIEIRRRYAYGETCDTLGAAFAVSRDAIWRIATRKNWAWLDDPERLPVRRGRRRAGSYEPSGTMDREQAEAALEACGLVATDDEITINDVVGDLNTLDWWKRRPANED